MDREQAAGSVDQDEVARFSRLAAQWWDARGPMAALHKFNPVRLTYIRDRAAEHFGRDPARLDSLAGLRVLDIGCGGGILSEPLARLGARVVGADPSESNIAVAKRHAERAGLSIDYRADAAEALAQSGETFDVVLAMEVVEHVVDLGLFIELAAGLVALRWRLSAPNTFYAGCRAARTDGKSSSRQTSWKLQSSRAVFKSSTKSASSIICSPTAGSSRRTPMSIT
jgi:2-polyprenyl-3-methyl-5-hydroxy-6-metoxy-1,4-benzoquinol methylase